MIKHMVSSIAILGIAISSASASSELESAQKLASQGVIKSANSATEFGLNKTITRKEMMKIVMNLSGKSVPNECKGSFGDVVNDWGCKYIESALANGFIASNANFRPNDSISKAESMKLILKAKDIDKAYNTSNWQADYMKTALDNGIISAAYSDHTASALRGWIFSVAAAEKGSHDVMEKKEDVMEKEDVMIKKDEVGYFDFDESHLGKSDKTVFFFHAAWCPSCRAADSSISANAGNIDDFLLLKTDYDSETDLRKKYGVTTQHTFVRINKDGDLIKKWSGGSTVGNIKDNIGL